MALRRDSNWAIPNFKNGSKLGPFSGGFNRNMKAPGGSLEQIDTYIPFDMVFAKASLPTVMPPPLEMTKARLADEAVLENALNARLKEIIASEEEKLKLDLVVMVVQNVLEELKNYTGEDSDSRKVEEIHVVGNYKRGALFTGTNSADIVVFLKLLPTTTVIEKFSEYVVQGLQSKNLEDTKMDPKMFTLKMEQENKGFTIEHPTASVNILITTSSRTLKAGKMNMSSDSSYTTTNEAAIKQAWWRVQQAEWMQKNATDDVLRNLSLILQDLSQKFSGLSSLTPWIIGVLSYYLVKINPKGEDLTMVQAFRRFFEVLSAGFFLPDSTAITDPCHPNKKPIHWRMSFEEQDQLTTTAQNLLRVFCHGGYDAIIGAQNDSIIKERSVWDGVVVAPLDTVYNKVPE